MKCRKCGAEVSPGAKFCTKCGTPVAGQPVQRNVQPVNRGVQSGNRTAQPANRGAQSVSRGVTPAAGTGGRQTPPPQTFTPAQQNFTPPPMGFAAVNNFTPIGQVIPDYNPAMDYKPLGMWSYFGFDVLFAIPFVGWILLIIFSVGGTSNINLRNYARSKFCALIIGVVLVILLSMAGVGLMSRW